MLEANTTAKEHRGRVSELASNWLNERQELLVIYCSLSGIEQIRVDERPFSEKMNCFCQALVDYVSAGHFGIYEKLQKKALAELNNNETLPCVAATFDSIQKNTDFLLDFNDGIDKFSNIQSLQTALSKLGECLEERFSLEDKLIAALNHPHHT